MASPMRRPDAAPPVPAADSSELASTLALAHTVDTSVGAHEPEGPFADRVPLAEPYRDQGEVARGGMGSVRSAWDSGLERHVAVKIVSPFFQGIGGGSTTVVIFSLEP